MSTQGPWQVVTTKDARGVKHLDVVAQSRQQTICRVFNTAIDTEADAQLIAAAPELLEALKFALSQLRASYEVTGGSHGDGIGLDAIKIVKKAITKAEGMKK